MASSGELKTMLADTRLQQLIKQIDSAGVNKEQALEDALHNNADFAAFTEVLLAALRNGGHT